MYPHPHPSRAMNACSCARSGMAGAADDLLSWSKKQIAKAGVSVTDVLASALPAQLEQLKVQVRAEIAAKKGIAPSDVKDTDVIAYITSLPLSAFTERMAGIAAEKADSYKPIVIGGFLLIAGGLYLGLKGRKP